MEKKMLANYNLLRILAIFLVISTHMLSGVWIADPASQSMAWHVREIIHTAALSCNGLFSCSAAASSWNALTEIFRPSIGSAS